MKNLENTAATGPVFGDVLGSAYEWSNRKTEHPEEIDLIYPGCHFTDDTVLTVATMDALLHGGDYAKAYREWGRRYPGAGYGGRFAEWLRDDGSGPYNSFGNGSAMRVGPVGWAFDSLEETLAEAARSAEATHNHPEGIKGALATAAAVFLARNGGSKADIKEYVEREFGYNLSRRLAAIRPSYRFDETCQGTVPVSLTVFLESGDFADAMRRAISVGGDTDTLACIAGAVAEAHYRDIPGDLLDFVRARLPAEITGMIGKFQERYRLMSRLA